MHKTIYVQLFEEGTICYRPVPAIEIENNIFQIAGYELYDSVRIENEIWEFTPGTTVIVEEKLLSNGPCLVAIKKK